MKTNLSAKLSLAIFGLSAFPAFAQQTTIKPEKPNILFIAVDDLKPILGCYGDKLVKSPNIDKLAKRGTVFTQSYCQQAVCGPTRASLLTGMRPDETKVWDLKTKMRDVNPKILSFPEYLISKGYSTQGLGKIYDPRCVDEDIDKPSWSVPFYKNANAYYAKETGKPAMNYQSPETKKLIEQYQKEADEKGLVKTEREDYVRARISPSVECADVPDNAYNDGANALMAKDLLAKLSKKNEPFFLAVGFVKPHLPFVAPKKYWDMYKRDEMPVAKYQKVAVNSPSIAYHQAGELRRYTDIPPLASFTDQQIGIGLPIEKQKELIHGYYACISYMDAQVGIVMNALDSLGLSKNTIVVLWGDHGWHLGDHDLWCKHTNFEQATRVPMIFSSPWIKPSITSTPSEFVDIFPTLCDLAGLPIPNHLDGKTLVPAMKDPKVKVKEFSVSQYPRSNSKNETERLGYANGQCMGYSIRTERYRYTIWMGENYRSTKPFDKKLLIASELYDYKKDPLETVNVADDENYSAVAKEMHNKMLAFLATQVKDK